MSDPCPACDGFGYPEGKPEEPCPECDGFGTPPIIDLEVVSE